MSIFKTIVEQENTELAARYQHLLLHAKNLKVESVLQKEFDEITEEICNELQDTIDREVMCQEVREQLGLDMEFHINSTDNLDWYLQKRLHYNSEIEAIKAQYDKLKTSTESQLYRLDNLFKEEAEGFTKSEYERTGKKTMIRPFGTAQLKDEKAKWVIEEERDLQKWLASLTDEEREEYKCKPKEWTRDLDAIKARAEKIRQHQGLESCMGLKWEAPGLHFKLQLPKEEK